MRTACVASVLALPLTCAALLHEPLSLAAHQPSPLSPRPGEPAPLPDKPLSPDRRKPDRPAPTLDEVIDRDAKVTTIASGMKFTEGPLWIPGQDNVPGFLLFSDIPADTIYKLETDRKDAKPEVFMKPSGFANGLTLDHKRRLVIAQHDGKVTRRDLKKPADEPTVLADNYEKKALNSPNDLVVATDGSVYFTDPPYGLRPPLGPENRKKELDFSGIYRLGLDGTLKLLSKAISTPNGLAFSPDGKTLYVTETSNGGIHALAVNADGTLSEPNRIATNDAGSAGGGRRSADGIKIDAKGHLYAAGPGGVWVYTAAGEHIGTIETPVSPTNLCFGGPENKTLFITARDSVYSVPVKIKGLAPGGADADD